MQFSETQLDDTDARKVLGSFLFTGNDVDIPAGVLSGANVLLLNEPTNSLDPASRQDFLRALATLSGTLVLVCHDIGAGAALKLDRF